MAIQQYNPFWVPFWQIKVNDWPNKKQKLLDLVDWDDPECNTETHFTDYHSKSNYLDSFIDLFLSDLKLFSENFNQGVRIKEVWAQRYTGSHFMWPHTHGPVGFSAILYAEFNSEVHNATTFYAPFESFSDGEILEHRPVVEEGEIIIFPSSILHFVEPSNNKEQRTIFSWNMIEDKI